MVTTSRILTVTVVVLAIVTVSALAYSQFLTNENSYNSKILVSLIKSPPVYDYSCSESDYQIYFVIRNIGLKNVVGLSISITNGLCVGAIPPLPDTLNSSSTMSFEAQTTTANGTLTIAGNNTFVQVKF